MIYLEIKIYGTGSSGNCVQVDHILIDAGLSRKKLDELGYNEDEIQLVIITHEHADHMNPAFIKNWIRQDKPCILSDGIINRLESKFKMENILDHHPNILCHPYTGKVGDVLVKTIPQKHHQIINYAVTLYKGDESLLYSTDLDTLEPSNIGAGLLHLGQFDHLLLEGNYDELWLRSFIEHAIDVVDPDLDVASLTWEELDRWVRSNYRQMSKDMSRDLFRAVQNQRHLSKQQARAYAAHHLKPGGTYYEMHRSSRFYQRPDYNGW